MQGPALEPQKHLPQAPVASTTRLMCQRGDDWLRNMRRTRRSRRSRLDDSLTMVQSLEVQRT